MNQSHKVFWFRRWHSFLGVLPVSIFLMFHLFVNSKATLGADQYNQFVSGLKALPFLEEIEFVFIFLPLLFHGIYGLYVAYTSGYNAGQYTWFRNQMFMWQRITGVITFIFVIWHLWTTRFSGVAPSFNMMADIVSSPVQYWFMILGVVASAFHLSNGLWGFLIHWGVTIGPRAQKISAYVMGCLWLVFSVFGISALIAFKNTLV